MDIAPADPATSAPTPWTADETAATPYPAAPALCSVANKDGATVKNISHRNFRRFQIKYSIAIIAKMVIRESPACDYTD